MMASSAVSGVCAIVGRLHSAAAAGVVLTVRSRNLKLLALEGPLRLPPGRRGRLKFNFSAVVRVAAGPGVTGIRVMALGVRAPWRGASVTVHTGTGPPGPPRELTVVTSESPAPRPRRRAPEPTDPPSQRLPVPVTERPSLVCYFESLYYQVAQAGGEVAGDTPAGSLGIRVGTPAMCHSDWALCLAGLVVISETVTRESKAPSSVLQTATTAGRLDGHRCTSRASSRTSVGPGFVPVGSLRLGQPH
jgi:hypothetical protein